MNNLRWISWIAAAGAVGVLTGCHGNSSPAAHINGADFPAQNEPRAVQNVVAAQAAAGARADSTLHKADFKHGQLNSLGQEKINLMLEDEDRDLPVTLYLDLSDESSFEPARTSVAAYLKVRGLTESQYHLEDGPNPHMSISAEDSIAALHAIDAQGATPPQPATSAGNVQPSFTSH